MSGWNNQKGYTLVELLVVIAILGVLAGAIFGFFHTSINSYKETGQETDLQFEAQRTINQLEFLIVNSTKDVKYEEETDASLNMIKRLEICHDTTTYHVEWKQEDETIMLTKKTPSTVSEPALMAEYVKVFNVTPKGKNVEFYLEYKRGKKEFKSNNTITRRNGPELSGTEVTDYDEVLWWKINSVDIKYNNNKPDGAITIPMTGSQQTIELTAVVNGTNNPSQKVQWYLEGANDTTNTKVLNTGSDLEAKCQVILGASENSENIKIYATAEVKNEADLSNASAIAYIKMVSP